MKRTLENPGGTIRVPKVYSMETCQSLRRKDREVKFISVYFFVRLFKQSYFFAQNKRREINFMWEQFNDVLVKIDDFVWGPPLMVLILAGGLLLTVR